MKLFHKTARWFLKKCHPGKPWSAGKYGKIIVSYFSHKLLICLTRKSMKTLSKRLLARKLTQIHLIINSDRRQLNSYSPHNFLRPITRKWIKNRSSYCPHNLLRPVTRKWTETSSKLEACWKNKGHNLHKLIAMSDLNNSDGNDIFGPMPLAFWFSTVFGTKMMLLGIGKLWKETCPIKLSNFDKRVSSWHTKSLIPLTKLFTEKHELPNFA